MEIKLKVELNEKEMFNFMMKHTYSTISGYIGLLLSVCALIGFVMTVGNEEVTITYKLVLIFTALLFTVIQPLNLYFKSKSQVKNNESINKPLEYKFTDSLIHISQGEEQADYEWNQVTKVSASGLCLFLYVSKYRAFVLPRRCFEKGELSAFREMVGRNAKSAKSINMGKGE